MLNHRLLAACAAVVVGPVAALAQPFAYQGRLENAGQPATGPHELRVRIFASPAGPDQVGVETLATVTPAPDGTFTLEVDPGAGVFTGPARWAEIAVRPAGSGVFTTLAPRQPVSPAPYALRALTEWLVPSGGTNLHVDLSRQRLFLGRSARLNSSEYFGFTAAAPDFTFGGMYVNIAGANALPFYGYSTGDGLRLCRTYFEGATQTWVVDNGGDRIRVQNNGDVAIGLPSATAKLDVGGTVRANAFAYSATQTRVLSVPGAAFNASLPNVSPTREVGPSGTFLDAGIGSAALVAPINLPDGCRITRIEFFVYENGASSFTGLLYRRTHGQFGSSGLVATPSSVNSANIQIIFADSSVLITNSVYSYYLSLGCSDWLGASTALFSARVTYITSAPE
ncbi:MAG: hypothetical protein SFY69_05345 [Planctomycetota bacterium]|nr:hypothetical protein [Planctomycetota bacterium]